MASQAHTSISAWCCPILQTLESAWASPPPLRCSNTSLVMSFPLHSPGRSAIKKDLCCPLSPISPLSVTEQREKAALRGEERGSNNRDTRHTSEDGLERADQRPRAYGVLFLPQNQTRTENKRGFPLFYWACILVKILLKSMGAEPASAAERPKPQKGIRAITVSLP